jgi:hypothetical protein
VGILFVAALSVVILFVVILVVVVDEDTRSIYLSHAKKTNCNEFAQS